MFDHLKINILCPKLCLFRKDIFSGHGKHYNPFKHVATVEQNFILEVSSKFYILILKCNQNCRNLINLNIFPVILTAQKNLLMPRLGVFYDYSL